MSAAAALWLLAAAAAPAGGGADGGILEALSAEAPDAGPSSGLLAIEPFEAEPQAPSPERGPEVRLFGRFRSRAGVDTSFDPPPGDAAPEDDFDLRARASLGADVKLSDGLRAVVEARARWRGAARGRFAHPRAEWEAELGEAYADFYLPRADVRVGQQIIPFGANAAFAPADALNPRDLREGLLLADPEDVRLPVFSVRARGDLGPWRWTAAYVPFFVPDRYAVFGQDEALLQPGWGIPPPPELDPSIEWRLQEHLLETHRPPDSGLDGDLGLRVQAKLGPADVGASWVTLHEKLPRVTLDPELQSLAGAAARGREPDPAVLLSVENRIAAGETLFSGTYPRQHLFSAEASALWGPAQLDLDATFSPRQTFIGERLEPLTKPAITVVLGASQAEESDWVWSIAWVTLAVPGVGADELLALIEPSTARGAPRTAWLHLAAAAVSYSMLDRDLVLSLRALFEPVQGSWAAAPEVRYRFARRYVGFLAAEIYEGSPFSPLGYWHRNSQVAAGLEIDLF